MSHQSAWGLTDCSRRACRGCVCTCRAHSRPAMSQSRVFIAKSEECAAVLGSAARDSRRSHARAPTRRPYGDLSPRDDVNPPEPLSLRQIDFYVAVSFVRFVSPFSLFSTSKQYAKKKKRRRSTPPSVFKINDSASRD